jgi:hypothetical protein
MTDKVQLQNVGEKQASIIIVTYNNKHFLNVCLNSIFTQEYPHEVIIVDNCSNDGTVSYVREHFPTVKVIGNSSNAGYGAGNNLGVKHAQGEYIVILNPDTIVHKGWLSALISPLENENNIITTPKILTYEGLTINTCGNINHFTGLNFTRGLGLSPDHYQEPTSTGGISGACFAMRKHDYEILGGFDETFFMYNEDSDFSWRAFQSGYTIKYIPNSVIRHYYTLKVAPEKLYYLEKGRYIILRKYFSRREMIILLPSLIMAEIFTWGYCLKQGKQGIRNKIRAMTEGLQQPVKIEHGNTDLLLSRLDSRIPETQLISNVFEKGIAVIGNIVFSLNYRMIK